MVPKHSWPSLLASLLLGVDSGLGLHAMDFGSCTSELGGGGRQIQADVKFNQRCDCAVGHPSAMTK